MCSIEWDAALETGDAVVDQQHRDIHALFNELEAAPVGDMAEVMSVLDRLMGHCDTHFATEEDLMERESYPRSLLDEHVAEHRDLVEGARDIVLKFRFGEMSDTADVVEFLRAWLTDHVHEKDRMLVDYMRERGAAAEMPSDPSGTARGT
jgi:hemerythrin-like metal-binding protein